jgi:hypothetical protein
VSIQTGFSDAGRFQGKSRGAGHRTPSGRLAEAMTANQATDRKL